ncbi:hypothetical protein P7K49_037850 [Saguinus oedipus]|uniref:Uncharacterized protein n=1 Tax=Saguinus oedipus TaxID=9490 RepID=A0ABQ9TKV4_SAGOE|nr:hypothetical protein P7K49_037850 [Saguinus oedipus]
MALRNLLNAISCPQHIITRQCECGGNGTENNHKKQPKLHVELTQRESPDLGRLDQPCPLQPVPPYPSAWAGAGAAAPL